MFSLPLLVMLICQEWLGELVVLGKTETKLGNAEFSFLINGKITVVVDVSWLLVVERVIKLLWLNVAQVGLSSLLKIAKTRRRATSVTTTRVVVVLHDNNSWERKKWEISINWCDWYQLSVLVMMRSRHYDDDNACSVWDLNTVGENLREMRDTEDDKWWHTWCSDFWLSLLLFVQLSWSVRCLQINVVVVTLRSFDAVSGEVTITVSVCPFLSETVLGEENSVCQ